MRGREAPQSFRGRRLQSWPVLDRRRQAGGPVRGLQGPCAEVSDDATRDWKREAPVAKVPRRNRADVAQR